MAHFAKQEAVDNLAKVSTLLLDNTHPEEFHGFSYKNTKEHSPFKKGAIVYALIDGVLKTVLVIGLDIRYSERADEYVDHIVGHIARKDGTFGTMYRHVSRGCITRGYEEARARGLVPEEVSV